MGKDPTGLFPTKNLSIAAADWKMAFEKTIETPDGIQYNRGGLSKGLEAAKTLKQYGETTGWGPSEKPTGKAVWMSGPDRKHPTADNARFVYTKAGGWIDMTHFMFYAGRARGYKERAEAEADEKGVCVDGAPEGVRRAMADGERQERWLDSKGSSYSYEDLPSDYFGADFGANVFDPHSDKTLAEQVDAYLQRLTPTEPKNAPNWSTVPSGEVMVTQPEIPRNKTTSPMFTSE